MATKYPEHQKLRAIKHLSQNVGEFIDWLQNERGIQLYERFGSQWHPTHTKTQDLLAEYFEINRDALEAEKEQMLEEMRGNHGAV